MAADQLAEVTRALQQDGVCVVRNVLDTDLVEKSKKAAIEKFDLFVALGDKYEEGGFGVGKEHGFAEGVQRSKGRFDVLFGMNRDPGFAWPSERWRRLLGGALDNPTLLFNGLLMAMPGTEDQAWHVDGEHLFGTGTGVLPAHCITACVPLVDLSIENGSTQFCLGSHLLTNAKRGIAIQNDSHLESIGFTGEVVQIECPAGALIMFDCRILHRTLANKSLHPSPLLYYSHARPWFQDVNNFPARSIAGTPIEAKDMVKGKVVTMAEQLRHLRKKVDGGKDRWGDITKNNNSISKSCN